MHPVSCSRHGHHRRHSEFRSLPTPPPSMDDPYDDYVHGKHEPRSESFETRNHHHHIQSQHPDGHVHTDVPNREECQPRFTHPKPHHHHHRHNMITPPPSRTPSPSSVRHHVHYHEYQHGPQFQHHHHTTKPGSPLSTNEGKDDGYEEPRLHTHRRSHYNSHQHQHHHQHHHHAYPSQTRGRQYRDSQTHTHMHTHTHIHSPGYTHGHVPSCFRAQSRHGPGKCGCRHQHRGHGHGQRGGGVKQFAYGPPLPIFVMAFPGGVC